MAASADNLQVELVHKLFLQHSSQLRGFILALLPDTELASDLLHEVFLLATAKAGDYQEGTSYMAWVKAIARFKVLEAVRFRRSRPAPLSVEVIETLCDSAPETGLDETQIAAIRSCIDNLPSRSKSLIDLRYRLECKPAEIAQRIGWQSQSVSVELSRARGLLRRCLRQKLEVFAT